MKAPLTLAALGEIATGLALVVVPALVGRLLLGAELTGVAIPVARVLGIALIALGVACWPGTPLLRHADLQRGRPRSISRISASRADSAAFFLWPAVVVHLILTALLARAATSDKKTF